MGSKAVIYCRVSTAGQVEEGTSLDAQEEKLRAYCMIQGLDVAQIFREEGVSATKPLSTRPLGSEVVRLVESGEVGHVVALKLDRLFRSSVDALTMTQNWDTHGVALHLVDMGGQSINTASAMGRMMLTMMAGFAQFERDLISERTTAALDHLKGHNRAYAPTPFGFDREGKELHRNEKEQSIIGKIRTWREEGRSLRDIARALNEMGIPGKKGGKWHASTVSYLLKTA